MSPQKIERGNILGKSLQTKIIWVFLIALFVRLLFIPSIDFALDDAYITFRVARNIAQGHGMVLNPGEQVLSITTPLYALLMVPGEILPISVVLWSKIMNSIFAAVSCTLIYALLHDKVNRGILLLAVLSLMLNPISIFVTLTGMESILVSMLILLSVLFYKKKMFVSLGVMLGLLCLARPEGWIAAFLFWTAVLVFQRKGIFKVTVPLALLSLGWFFYANMVFGSVIPNSYVAKQAFFSVHPVGQFRNLSQYYRFFTPSIPFAIIAPVFLLFGTWVAFSRNREFLPVSIWLSVIIFLQLTSALYIAWWYMHLLIPIIILILFLGVQKILDLLPKRLKSILHSRGASVTSGVIILAYMAFFSWQIRAELSDMQILDEQMGKIANWFVINNIPSDKVVGLEAIGRLGYDSNLTILDRMGLASPEVIPLLLIQQDNDTNIMCTFQPDYYVTNLVIAEEEAPGYRPIAVFPMPSVSRSNDTDAIMGNQSFIYEYVE